MSGYDYAIVFAFFVGIFAAGIAFYKWVSNADDFYVAGRQLTPFILAATLTATNVNLYSFVGQAGKASSGGIGMIWQTWTGNMALVLAGLFIIPVLRRLRIRTVPEFLEIRYGRSARMLVAAAIFLRLAFWLGIVLNFAVTVAIEVTGLREISIGAVSIDAWYFWLCVFALITVIYTVVGGMWSVALTDVLQFILMMVGALIVLPLIMKAVGWWPGLKEALPPGHLQLIKTGGEFNWFFVLAIMVLGIQWASTDQGLIQRAFAAKNTKTVAKGMVLAGIVTTPFAFLWILPGLASRVYLAKTGVALPENVDAIIPMMLTHLLMPGVLGLVLCGLLASQMSTIDSNLSAAATLFVNDIYGRFTKREPGTKTLLRAARIVTFVAGIFMMVFAFILAKVVKQESGVNSYLTIIAIFDMPLFVIVVLFGFFSRWANLPGALVGYIAGAVGGTIGMILSGAAKALAAGLADGSIVPGTTLMQFIGGTSMSFPALVGNGDYNLAVFISAGSAIVGVVIGSLFGKRPTSEQTSPVTQARTISQEEIDAHDIYHIWPESAAGKACVVLLGIAFCVFLLGVIIGSQNGAVGSVIAAAGMIAFFIMGAARLFFK